MQACCRCGGHGTFKGRHRTPRQPRQHNRNRANKARSQAARQSNRSAESDSQGAPPTHQTLRPDGVRAADRSGRPKRTNAHKREAGRTGARKLEPQRATRKRTHGQDGREATALVLRRGPFGHWQALAGQRDADHFGLASPPQPRSPDSAKPPLVGLALGDWSLGTGLGPALGQPTSRGPAPLLVDLAFAEKPRSTDRSSPARLHLLPPLVLRRGPSATGTPLLPSGRPTTSVRHHLLTLGRLNLARALWSA